MSLILESVRRVKRRFLWKREGERILRERFATVHGGSLDNPKTFTEKVYQRMIDLNRKDNPLCSRLVDKYSVREYVAGIVGKEHVIPLIWHGKDPAQIPFDNLPAKVMAKTNHGSGSNIVIQKNSDRGAIVAKLRKWLLQNYYWVQREAQYRKIEPIVLVEEFLDDGNVDGPIDYRFWCFNGKPEAIQVDNNSHTMNAFYSTSWDLTGATYRSSSGIREWEKPANLDGLISVASRLSAPFDFVRVDLYSVRGKPYFGEFTFAPTAGYNKFDPPHWDLYFGDRWKYKSRVDK